MKSAILVFTTALALFLTPVQAADFESGVAAFDEGDYATALKEFEPLAEQGHAEAQVMLAQMYYRGEGVPPDYAQAAAWFRRAADQGHAGAQTALGLIYVNGDGVPKDSEKGMTWLRRAADQGLAEAQLFLGGGYYKGLGVPQDFKKAAIWYRRAANQGNAQAQATLGDMYFMGRGVPKDPLIAYMLVIQGSEQGIGSARLTRYVLANILKLKPIDLRRAQQMADDCIARNYKNCLDADAQAGSGDNQERTEPDPKDAADAAEYYRIAALQGDAEAQTMLGSLYMNGDGVSQDYAQAATWFRRAADQGDAYAQFELGLMYFNGSGVPQDYLTAYMLLTVAETQGYFPAALIRSVAIETMSADDVKRAQQMADDCIARNYKNCLVADAQAGSGDIQEKAAPVPKDAAEAVEYYRIAALQGDAEAQVELALKYAAGNGVTKDYVVAYLLARLGSAQGNERALALEDVLTSRMEADDVARAEQKAVDCLARNYKGCGF